MNAPFDIRSEIVALLPQLGRYASGLTREREASADLLHDTVAQALECEHQFRPGTNLPAWLFTIMRHIWQNSFRRSRRVVYMDPQSAIFANLPDADGRDARDDLHEIARITGTIPQCYIAPLMMHADGGTYDEIAAELKCRVGTVKSRISRTRSEIAAALDAAPQPRRRHRPRPVRTPIETAG